MINGKSPESHLVIRMMAAFKCVYTRGLGGWGVTPFIKVYGDVPQVWVMFMVFIRVINSRF